MTPEVRRITRSEDYGTRGSKCLCCPSGEHIPDIPGESRLKRYIFPGIILGVFVSAALGSLYYHHVQQSRTEQTQHADISLKIK